MRKRTLALYGLRSLKYHAQPLNRAIEVALSEAPSSSLYDVSEQGRLWRDGTVCLCGILFT